ncbi:MAG: protease HtpX, partial [Rhizobiales bacterium]|nr:protease HtpX [Hyphomicrobiales bacterium]
TENRIAALMAMEAERGGSGGGARPAARVDLPGGFRSNRPAASEPRGPWGGANPDSGSSGRGPWG